MTPDSREWWQQVARQLGAEVDILRKQLKAAEEQNVEWERKYAWRTASLDVTEQLDAAKECCAALAKWDKHDAHYCEAFHGEQYECSCGLRAAQAVLRRYRLTLKAPANRNYDPRRYCAKCSCAVMPGSACKEGGSHDLKNGR